MNQDLANPFSELIEPEPQISAATPKPDEPINALDQKINLLIEQTFMITVNKAPSKKRPMIFMEDIAEVLPKPILDTNILEQALFERILLSNPSDFLLPNDVKPDDHQDVTESRVLIYLHGAYIRNARSYNNQNDTIIKEASGKIRELIIRNVATAVKQPDLYDGQNLGEQLLELVRHNECDSTLTGQFISEVTKEVMVDNEPNDYIALMHVLLRILKEIQNEAMSATLVTIPVWIFPTIQMFVGDKTNPVLANIFLNYSTPPNGANGNRFAETLLGYLLRLSILPKNQNGPAEYFEGVMNTQDTSISGSLWTALRHHLDNVHAVFRSLLGHAGDTRTTLLKWIGDCLQANVARGQLWNSHNPTADMFGSMTTASDSFMIGLAGVLLRLCKPLMKPGLRVMLVDPTYCSVPKDKRISKGVHIPGMDKETCLIPKSDENEQLVTAETYNFITECFFMTHKALDLSE